MEYVVGKNPCKRCRSKGGDVSGNNFHFYGEGLGGHCFSCGFSVPSDAFKEENGLNDKDDDEDFEEVMTREQITPEEAAQIKKITGTATRDYRGIRTEISKPFGVRFQYDEETGDIVKMFVPTTIEGELAGYRTRKMPKDFSNPIGRVGKECDMIGEFFFKTHNHTVIITGGETKVLTTYQMLKDDMERRGKSYDAPAVVCSTLGESGAHKQVQSRYQFFDRFQKIIICMDNDKAGIEAAEKVAKVLPKGRVFIMKMRYKDADDYLEAGKEREFVTDFWNAVPYTPAGVVAASTIYDEIVERSKVDKLPFPPALNKMNRMLAGGINYGYIVNILAGSGVGKSALVNTCISHWMTTCNKKVLVVSLEAEASEFGENLLSSTMQRKIAMIEDKEEKIAFVSSEEARTAANNLFLFPDGTPRLYLLDDRGDFSKLQEKIEECVTMHDIQIVVIDVISDVFSGATVEEVDKWMKWEKNLVKATNCILVQVAHTKKPSSGAKAASVGGTINEEMLIGSGTQFRSAGINIALQRDKSHEDMMMRNTTEVFLLKSRATGITGKALELFYDNETATLWDKEEWLETQTGHDFENPGQASNDSNAFKPKRA